MILSRFLRASLSYAPLLRQRRSIQRWTGPRISPTRDLAVILCSGFMEEKECSPRPPPESSRWNKEAFLATHAAAGEYGYGRGWNGTLEVDELRAREFPSLRHPEANPAGMVYLDHAGATLYSRNQLARATQMMMDGVYGNPHSKGPAASATAEQVEVVRGAILDHFHAPHQDWALVFTSGATASLKLLAESFPWGRERSRLFYALNSHTSVLGMREYALQAGASFRCLPSDFTALRARLAQEWGGAAADAAPQAGATTASEKEEGGEQVDDLLVLPAECNFSGRKLDLSLLPLLPRTGPGGRRLWVVLDAAKHVATAPLDLGQLGCSVDAVCVSFYKVFGYPTGLGCLLLRRELAERLTGKAYFGGGTVQAALADGAFRALRPEPEKRLADGTENYLGILSLLPGLEAVRALGGMARIQQHTFALTRFLHQQLRALRHGSNGAPVCVVYAPPVLAGMEAHGPVLAFNLLRPSGEFVGYAEVERLAELHGIQLRTGCFCNPGACQEALGLSTEEVLANLQAGHVCWDDHDIIDGRPTGAIRASFGYMSTWEDATALLQLIDKYFTAKHMMMAPSAATQVTARLPASMPQASSVHLSSLILYPIKSCAGMAVPRWPLGPSGLLFDREWAIVDSTGRALRLKQAPSMCLIRPRICLETQRVWVSAPGMEDLSLSLSAMPPPERSRSVSVCGEACQAVAYEAAVSDWFTRYLGQPCTLVRSSPYAQRRAVRGVTDEDEKEEVQPGAAEGEEGKSSSSSSSRRSIAFSNEAQFLLVSTASVDHLNALIAHQAHLDGYEFRFQGDKSESFVTIENFRPNLVVSGGVAHQEDLWRGLQLQCQQRQPGGNQQHVALQLRVTGPCSRCSMVNIDHRDGSKAAPVLKTLATYRRDKAKICFGQFLTVSSSSPGDHGEVWLQVGSSVKPVMATGEGGLEEEERAMAGLALE